MATDEGYAGIHTGAQIDEGITKANAAVRQINITGRNLTPTNGVADLGITASTTDLTPGVSALATGTIRLVYE